ncbi:MAG TPA: dihydrofolate reductase family protein [Candidatus Limnocylindrales bacterium]|nr:dihydrofolate reductase family protein [Candidatus Limnocylindrales bacterium]
MGKVTFHIAVSLDGYAAGPDQNLDDPIGKGGMRLHEWLFPLAVFSGTGEGEVNESTPVVQAWTANIGAHIMGRNMFGPGRGEWDESWTGWWGEDPPYHTPVFVLTHHEREPLTMKGGTTFHFLTDGIESALAQARQAAGDKDILIAGGASTIQQYLAAGLVDEFELSVAPVLLGRGERLLDNLGASLPEVEQVRAVGAPGVTHLLYRVR